MRTVLFLIACAFVLILTGPLAKGTSPLVGMLCVGIVAAASTFLLTLVFVHWERLKLRDVGTALTTNSVPRWLLGFAMGFGLVAVQDLALYLVGHVHWIYGESHAGPGVVLLALAAYFALALREELAFRGYPLRRLEAAVGWWSALLLMAIAFGVEHAAGGGTWSRSLLGPAAGALLFGVAALTTRGIAVPLGIHAAFNFGQWVMGQKDVAGPLRVVVDPGYSRRAESVGYAAYLASVLIGTIGFWVWWRSHRRDVPG